MDVQVVGSVYGADTLYLQNDDIDETIALPHRKVYKKGSYGTFAVSPLHLKSQVMI